MDKRKKMILSITGIVIVLLFIIGFTFGYVLLKIKGNENSILSSFTSKKVSVAYKEISNTSNGETISPSYEFIKVFTATNDGNVEVNYHIYLDNVENEFVRTQDITYTLYRSELNGTLDTSNLSDSNIVATGTFPTTDAYIKFNEEIETPNNYYTYALKINYAKTTDSQDEDDGHIFSFRVQLDMNYPFKEGTLAYNILNNAVNVTDEEKTSGYAEYMTFPPTKPAQEASTASENVLSLTSDDYGTSYYFRGNVTNNYVNYSGMCWRIVRVQGDGGIKLALADRDGECNASTYSADNVDSAFIASRLQRFVYKNDCSYTPSNFIYSNSNIKGVLEAWAGLIDDRSYTYYSYTDSSAHSETFTNNSLDATKLVNAEWCVDITSDSIGSRKYYSGYTRLYNPPTALPTLKCGLLGYTDTHKSLSKIGMLSADEVAFAGGIYTSAYDVYNHYLRTNATENYWTLTPMYYYSKGNSLQGFIAKSNGGLYNNSSVDCGYNGNGVTARPAIVLNKDVEITSMDQDGTISNPYIIE